MSSVSELYQSVILDHNRTPRNYGRLEGEGARQAKGHNPLCGDQVTVWLQLDGDVVTDVRFEDSGHNCAISRASASLMTMAVKGKTRQEVEQLFAGFHGLVTGGSAPEDLPARLKVFANVAAFPVRVKCASLAWHTLRQALNETTTA